MPKSSHKKGGAKKEYTGTYRHFTLHEVNGKEVEIGTATIKDYQTPLNAAKKLLSSYCRHEGIKSNERNKINITFTIRETTRGHSKIYGPYKGKFVKYDKPVMIKLKSGKVIKRTVKPMVKLSKGNNNKKMMGGQSNSLYRVIEKDLRNMIILTIDTEAQWIKDLRDRYSHNSHKKTLDNINNQLKDLLEKKTELLENQPLLKGLEYYDFKLQSNGKYQLKLSEFNVSNIDNMSELFKFFNFNNINSQYADISKWNVSNVTDMNCMFMYSNGFNQDLSKWNVSKVENMDTMFKECKDFNKGLNWNISFTTKIEGIFSGCDQLIEKDGIFLKKNININIYNRNGCFAIRLKRSSGKHIEGEGKPNYQTSRCFPKKTEFIKK